MCISLFHSIQTDFGGHLACCLMFTGFFLEVKRSEREGDYLPLTSTKSKWSYITTSSYVFLSCTRKLYQFFLLTLLVFERVCWNLNWVR
jgi:hypothetical protein